MRGRARIGKVRLMDGAEVLGVLGEPILCEGRREITRWGRMARVHGGGRAGEA